MYYTENMMKGFLRTGYVTIMTLLLASCVKSSVQLDPDLTENEKKAVLATEKSVSHLGSITEYEVFTAKVPAAMFDDKFKPYRDAVYKAALDYRACMTRGLDMAAQQQVERLETYQSDVVALAEEIEGASPEYLIVLAEVKEKRRNEGKVTGVVAVFDPSIMQMVEWREVTTPLVNNALMIAEAEDGMLVECSINTPVDNSAIISKIANPVVRFILKVDPK